MSQSTNFVTVVAVRTGEQEGNKENINFDANSQGYVTVLTISDAENNNKTLKGITEEVIVYRLPGEKLGFGLKFEGGTKANEFVKRLFIQSCAADSPASRVQSSWGKLTEGDEVLEIDSIPVNTMTRIDCVRCLKDSNVAIKLLVRHLCEKPTENKHPEGEEKRLPPVPPPVPPRKIHRKMLKNTPKESNTVDASQENDIASQPVTSAKPPKKLQHSRSMRAYYSSPDVHRRVRRFSDGNLGPPEAAVYTDLISQESTQSLSESDDTESTISTVIDKFGSVPNTTTSSFAGSLPSTPTSIQKKLDVSNLAVYDDEECVAPPKLPAKPLVQNREENNNVIDGVDPLCFQDAPLSYGNENTAVLCFNESESAKEDPIKEEKHSKKPPVPPRARTTVLTTVDTANKDKKSENLPRLVDFVPKSANSPKDIPENSAEIMRLFLENERHKTSAIDYKAPESDNYRNGIDMYCSKWSLSFQLATIGEVEEESGADPSTKPSIKTTPVVIVESADGNSEKQAFHNGTMNGIGNKESDGIMSTPPTDSRQPPDGHEFPDFIEDTGIPNSYFNETKREPTFTTFTAEYDLPQKQKVVENSPPNATNLTQVGSASNTDLRTNIYDSSENVSSDDSIPDPVYLHRRSQSLINMSTLSKEKNSKWNQLIEQRKRGMSKLKGLVIPEASENDVPAVNSSVNIPEIKSHTASLIQVPKETNCANSPQKVFTDNSDVVDPLKYSVLTPPWSAESPSNIPKYSPAFKRKSLQVYPKTVNNETYEFVPEYCDKSSPNPCPRKQSDEDINPPKSLESISSPTRSDCSFDYTCFPKKTGDKNGDSTQKSIKEDESDNDSAVSSSQFSYNSRFSPPPSPTKSCEDSFLKRSDDDDNNGPNRLLKPFSIEAINRKNILASAKCRSGKDFKIGSPVIKRKTEETETGSVEETMEILADNPPADEPNEPVEEVELVETAEVVEAVEVEPPIETVEKEQVKIATETERKTETQKPIEVKVLQNEVKEIDQVDQLKAPKVVENAKLSSSRPISRSSLDLRSPSILEDDRKNRYTKDLYGSGSILNRNHKPINVKVLKENFENFGSSPPPMPQKVANYKLPIVKKSVKAEVSNIEQTIPSSPQNSPDIKKAKSVENIKPSDVKSKKLFERGLVDKVEKFERASCQDSNVMTMVLTLETLESNLGVALAGGADEQKEITVHRIRYGSVAYSDGRLKKGDKILAINGKSTKGLNLAEATELLKEKTKKFVFQVREGIESVPSSGLSRRSSSVSSIYSLPEATGSQIEPVTKKPTNLITFSKDDSGFGFSIEGGKDPFKGDMPLIVKKVFTGGAADKNGELKVGDEIIYINDVNVSHLSKMEAWNAMKKIPNGVVNIHVYR